MGCITRESVIVCMSYDVYSHALSLPGFLQEDHQAQAGVWQVWTQLQNPKEEPQQVPVLPIPQMPLSGHVPQW